VRSLSTVARSKRSQSPRKYRQSKLAIGSFHASTASQQPSAVVDHSSTPLISTSMLSPPVPEQLSRDASPSSTTPNSTFSQPSTKSTQSKLTADSFYQQANATQRSPSVLVHSFAGPSNRKSYFERFAAFDCLESANKPGVFCGAHREQVSISVVKKVHTAKADFW